jgi:hypothetical protein
MKRVATLLIAVWIVPAVLLAQSASTDLSIETIPINPGPGETVTLKAISYGVDLSQTSMTWTYNNNVIAQGVGKSTISLVAPNAGTAGTVTVTAAGGGTQEGASAFVTLRPASADLLWEAADAYTPPFYKGKALLPVGGLVRVTAIPSPGAPRSLSYEWSRANSALQSESGFGKSSVTFQQSALNGQEKVDVTIQSGTFSGASTLRIAPYTPKLITYENKDGFVDYARGFNTNINLTKPGFVLHFEPYYFSAPTMSINDLDIETFVDGERVLTSRQNELALSRPQNGGQSTIRLAITTVAYTLQNLEKTITLLFN